MSTIVAVRKARTEALDPLNAERSTNYSKMKAIGEKSKKDFKTGTDDVEFDRLKKSIEALDIKIEATEKEYDAEIKRLQDVQDLERKSAQAVGGQDRSTVPAEAKDDPWTSEAAAKAKGLITNKGLVFGGIAKMIGLGGGSFFEARQHAKDIYGESHPITKALLAGVGASGGFMVPPEYINEIIELLRPMAVVRSANPRTMPMPRGTMTLPSQTQAATATYTGETAQIPQSQQQLGQIVATYKKLTALVPVTNDLMRYSDPAADAFVRDDLVKVMALREDLAFMLGDGTAETPRGFLSFANAWALQNLGSQGSWLTTAASTAAVGGNFITSTLAYTLATAAAELGGAVNKLDTANVLDARRCWFMHPRIWNYLNNVQNSLGVYVYRDELSRGTLLGYPFKKSTQIPINIWDVTATNKDCSFIFLVEMTDAMILDAMTMELAVSREGMYIDSTGATVSAFQKDQTIIRAIQEHDFQMRHPASIAVIQFVRWAPAIS